MASRHVENKVGVYLPRLLSVGVTSHLGRSWTTVKMVSVGAEKWKESTISTIKVAQTLAVQAQEGADRSRLGDPLPSLRDSCINESNRRIQTYARSTRDAVIRLKQAVLATNEEIKALNRIRQLLEKSLDHCRKDITLNTHCVHMRQERPAREQFPNDKGDHLLSAEHGQLLQQKAELEAMLKNVLAVLQMLNGSRSTLTSILQERSRATELICHSLSSSYNTRLALPSPRHIKSLSAPPVVLGNTQEGNTAAPLDPVTSVMMDAMLKATEVRQQSSQLRTDCIAVVERLRQQQSSAHQTVNHALIQKVAETVTLSQHLLINGGEAKLTQQKSCRLLKQQEKSLGYLLGPEMSGDITKRERLDRPLVRVYQQHPGTDLPEAAHLIDATDTIMDSIAQTQRNISLLKLARRKLREDYRDKRIATEIDSNVVRMRRRKADHRWVLRGNSVPFSLPGNR